MSPTPAASPPTANARRELLALAALGLLAFASAWRCALFDRLIEAARRLADMPVDALLVTILVLTPALGLYAWRRWQEVRHELAARSAAEAALHAREAQLGLLTRQLPAFLWTTDADLRLTMFAGGGFRRGDIDPRGRVGLTVAEFFGVDDPAFPPLAAHRRALGGEPAEYPLHRDGREYEVRVEPLRDADGAIVGTLGLGVDVTARERAAAALRDSEARFRAIFAGAAIGIGLADLDRLPLMVNPALARLTGRNGDGADGHGFGRATHPEDTSRDDALFAELVAGRRDHYQLEKRYVRPDGTTIWGRLTTSLVRDIGGAPQYAIGMVEDITARVAAEAALRTREARYQAVMEQAAEGIFLFEADSKRLVEANLACHRLLGYSEGDIAALTLYDVVAHDRASIDANTARIVADGQHAVGERDYRRKDGATVPVEVSATALRGDAGPLLCVVVRDLSAQRMAGAALRASEARLRTVVENAPVILFALDTAGVVTLVAGRGLITLGHPAEKIVGHPLFAAGPYARTIGAYARRALAGETVQAQVAVGDLIFATHYAPLYDEVGTVAGVIGVAADVTARAVAEVARDDARQRLTAVREEERLALARELHDEAIQELLGIRLALQLGERDLGADTAHPEVVTLLDEGARALREVVERLRRIVSGLRPAGLEELGLIAALEGYAAHVRRKEAGAGLAVALDLDPGGSTLPPPVARVFFRVAQEGLRNVRRHAGACRAVINLRVTEGMAILCVEDDGRGFAPPPALDLLARAGHFGLVGLAEQLADLGGTLEIASQPGQGTTLVARTPLGTGEGDDG